MVFVVGGSFRHRKPEEVVFHRGSAKRSLHTACGMHRGSMNLIRLDQAQLLGRSCQKCYPPPPRGVMPPQLAPLVAEQVFGRPMSRDEEAGVLAWYREHP